jgi:hypothetical protein
MWATWMMLRRSPEEIVMVEALRFVHLIATHYPKMLLHDTRFATLVVPWLDGVLYDDADDFGEDDQKSIDTIQGYSMPLLSGITNTSVTSYSQPRARHGKEVQRLAVQCLKQIARYDGRMAMLVARRLFGVINREQSSLDLARNVVPSLPFGATTSSVGSGEDNDSGAAPAECVPTTVPPLVGLQGRGLLAVHSSHSSHTSSLQQYGSSGLSLVQECREALISLSVMDHSDEWTTAWMSTCEDIIFAKKGRGIAGDGAQGDDSDGSSDGSGDEGDEHQQNIEQQSHSGRLVDALVSVVVADSGGGDNNSSNGGSTSTVTSSTTTTTTTTGDSLPPTW